MDLGATVCTRSKPDCTACPLQDQCLALKTDTISNFPGRNPSKTLPVKATVMHMLHNRMNQVLLEKRPPSGIWGGLWSLPELNGSELEDWCQDRFENSNAEPEPWQTLRHSFSHYDLDIKPVVVRIESVSRTVADNGDVTWHALDASPPGGIAAPVQKLINTLKNELHVQNN